MIQELYFVPHSTSRAKNQMNTSVTLRYDTKTGQLQLVDVFGTTKTISVDTTPDIDTDEIASIVNQDFIKDLGFETAEETAAKMPVYNAGYGIQFDEPTSTFFLSKGWLKARTSEYILSNEGVNDVKSAITLDYLTGLGVVTVDSDQNTLYSGQSGIIVNDNQVVSIDHDYLTAYIAGLGYVPHDNDHLYVADEELLNLVISDETNTFVVNKEALSSFVGTYLDENKYINEQENPLTYSAGTGIGIEVDEVSNKNVISLTAHIPAYTAGSGISITADGEDFVVAFTEHIPTGLAEWEADVNSAYIRDFGFALTSELSDTLYFAGTGITLTTEPNNGQNLFNIDTQWLDTTIRSYNYITGYVNTTYTGSDSIQITGDENVISVNSNWFTETVAPLVIANIGSTAGQTAVKNIVTKDYISSLGFRLADDDEDTYYYAGTGLNIAETTFSVNTDWLVNQISGFISANVTSTWLSGTGIAISDTRAKSGMGIIVEDDENSGPVAKTQTINVNTDWLNNFINTYNFDHNITSRNSLAAGNGIGISTSNNIDIISLTAHIPTTVAELTDANNYALTANLPTSYMTSADVSGIVEGYGYVTTDTTYTAGNGIKIDQDNVISLTANIPLVPNNVAAFENDAHYATTAYVINKITELDKDTKYTQGTGVTISGDTNIITIDQTWLRGFVADLGYLPISGDQNTLYHADEESIILTVEEGTEQLPARNVFSVNQTWLNNFVTQKITELDQDTTYTAGEGLKLEGTEFSLTASIPTGLNVWKSADNKQYISDIGFAQTSAVTAVSDRVTAIEADYLKAANIAGMATTDFVTGQVNDLATGAVATNTSDIGSISSRLETVENNYALLTEVPTGLASWETSANTEYIAGLGFVLTGDDKDTKYGVVSEGGLTVNTDHNFAIDTNWMNNRLSGYALKQELPIIPSAVSEFENDANYATVEQLPTKVSDLSNDKSFVTVADLEAVRLSLLQQFANITSITSVDGSVNAPDQNIFIDSDSTLTANATFNGKNITVNKLNNADSYTKFVSTGDVVMSNVTNEGTLPKATSNAQIIVNTPSRVSITEGTIAQNGYNAVEIGLDSSIEPPKSVLIDGVDFTGTLSNNAINIFGTADDAVVTISNCTFTKVSNAIRISNRTNAHVTVNIVNCQFTEWEHTQMDYAGMILCQDYTSQSADAAETNNLFAPEKVTINISNCTHAGAKIQAAAPSAILGSSDVNQILYVYRDKSGLVAYDAAKYPTVSIN